MSQKIIEHIWSGTLNLREEPDLSPLARVFSSLLATPMVCFTLSTTKKDQDPFAAFAGDQMLMGASLADILFEEYGIEVSDETIVLFEPAGQSVNRKPNTEALGLALGNVLVDLASSSHFEIPAKLARKKPSIQPLMSKHRAPVELTQ